MADLAINTDILFAQASQLDTTADELASVSLPAAPDLSVSSEEVSHVIEHLQSTVSDAAIGIRADADAARAGAKDIIEAEEEVRRQAQLIASSLPGTHLYPRPTRKIVVQAIAGVPVQVEVG